MMRVEGRGPDKADIVIVGEAPGLDEELEGAPFVGASGKLLSKLLREAGIRRDSCYITNVCKYRPPGNDISKWLTDKKREGIKNEWLPVSGRYASAEVVEGLNELYTEVAARQPKIILGLGNTALWAFTGEWGITDWRGSEITLSHPSVGPLQGTAFVPTLHPASVLRAWPTRAYVAHDLTTRVERRIQGALAQEPAWDFCIAPTLEQVKAFLAEAFSQGRAAVDVETSRGRIVCVGIALSKTRAMCIPFIHENYGAYWTAEEARIVVGMLQGVLSRIKVIGQNFNYDASYFADNFDMPLYVAHDTKIAQNVLFPGTPANLGFLSSMYCGWHCYWKDDARDWNNLKEFDRLFVYNCRDVCATYEIACVQEGRLQATGLQPQFQERMRYNAYVLRMQQRGVIRCEVETARLESEIEEALTQRAHLIGEQAGCAINVASPVQVASVLYGQFGCRKPLRVAGGTGDDALKQVAKWHPEREAFCTAVQEWRSLASMRNNFLHAKLDPDGLLRSSFMATGTETYRLTSSKNNFRRGTNLLNISGNGTTHAGNKVPNFRKAIVPPAGYTVFDCDLARADLQVVVWEADDVDLKAKMRAGVDIHAENAKDLFGVATPTPQQREFGKTFVHLTNYGGGARICAMSVGCTVHEADMAQRRWLCAHPGIGVWHKRVRAQLEATRTITNKFGYRMVFFDRVDDAMFRAALAWVPQSTVAIVASLVHMRMEDEAGVDVLLQMYDSVMGVYPTVQEESVLPKLWEATRILIPYDDPLVIPMGLKTSARSWGDCSKRDWPLLARAA